MCLFTFGDIVQWANMSQEDRDRAGEPTSGVKDGASSGLLPDPTEIERNDGARREKTGVAAK